MSGAECFVRVQADLSENLLPNKGLKQGDALACLLLNLALEKAEEGSGIQASGTLLNKTVQLLAYADDIDIIARSMNAMKEAFLALEMAED
uniref:Reverse transcriptase domain-containing protein n=1 Tax=Rhodnius prolixus TaxID=13249 RepID=T1HAA6_RHOPR